MILKHLIPKNLIFFKKYLNLSDAQIVNEAPKFRCKIGNHKPIQLGRYTMGVIGWVVSPCFSFISF